MLTIGWSRKDISTAEPVNIPGQFRVRISKGILDPVLVHCLVLEDDGELAIFLSADLVNGYGVIEDIREKLSKKRPDIPCDRVMLNTTHTHAGPGVEKTHPYTDTPHEGVAVCPGEKYNAFFVHQAVAAIIEAYDSREEGSFSYGYGYAVVGHHRRSTYSEDLSLREGATHGKNNPLFADGHAKMYGPTNDEAFIGYEGNVDHYVNLLYTFDKNDKLTGAIINVPCPSQNSEQEEMLSADYWNEVREMIHKKHGDIYLLSQCAAAGDMSPRTLHYKEAEARRYALKYGEVPNAHLLNRPWEMYNRYDIAERISVAFDEVLAWAEKDKIRDARLRHTVKTISLPRNLISEEIFAFVKGERASLADTYPEPTEGTPMEKFQKRVSATAVRRRLDNVIRRYEKQQETKEIEMELHVISLGDIAFAMNPFELYIDYQHQIQAKSPFTQTFIVQLTDQPKGYARGYLAHERAAKNRGYSATYHNQVAAEGGTKLVHETLATLHEHK